MSTTADLLNKLVSQKNTLADNLVEKGVEATHDETLKTLVPKVLDIIQGNDITAKGNPVQIDGLQGGVPFSEMAVSGKNLYYGNLIIGMVQVGTGTMTGGSQYLSTPNYISVNGDCTYSLSNFENKQFDAVVYYDFNKSYISATPLNRVEPLISHFATPQNCKYIRWRYCFDNAASIDMLTNIQLELGDTPTEYEPPITGRELTVNVSGKNLIPYPYNRASGTYNGIELIVHDDGRFDMSGTATASFAILVFAGSSNPIYLSGGQTYTISCNTPYDFSKFNISAKIYHTDGSYTSIIKFPTTFVAQEGEYLHCTLWIESDVSVSAKNVELQLEYGDTATDYEPYSGATYTITPDSNPYTVPNDIRQQDGLNTISVSAGTLSVTGVRKNAAIKRIWDEIDEIKTAIIVSNGET